MARGRDAHGTELGLLPVPPLAEINADAQFFGICITAAEFETLWLEHVPMAPIAKIVAHILPFAS